MVLQFGSYCTGRAFMTSKRSRRQLDMYMYEAVEIFGLNPENFKSRSQIVK